MTVKGIMVDGHTLSQNYINKTNIHNEVMALLTNRCRHGTLLKFFKCQKCENEKTIEELIDEAVKKTFDKISSN